MFDVNSNAVDQQTTVVDQTRQPTHGQATSPLRGVYGVRVHPGSQDTDSADDEEVSLEEGALSYSAMW